MNTTTAREAGSYGHAGLSIPLDNPPMHLERDEFHFVEKEVDTPVATSPEAEPQAFAVAIVRSRTSLYELRLLSFREAGAHKAFGIKRTTLWPLESKTELLTSPTYGKYLQEEAALALFDKEVDKAFPPVVLPNGKTVRTCFCLL